MNKNTSFIEVHWTCANQKEAKVVAQQLVQNRLVACVQIFPAIESMYIWKGKVEVEREVKVVMKTVQECYEKVEKTILEYAQYDVPEILVVPIAYGFENYLEWLKTTVSKPGLDLNREL